VTDKDRTRLVFVGNQFVGRLEPLSDFAHHLAESLAGMPQIGIARDAIEFLGGNRRPKIESRADHRLLERAGRQDANVMTSLAKAPSDPNVRMNVAARTHWCHQETHGGNRDLSVK
jgi:hypothetical protein